MQIKYYQRKTHDTFIGTGVPIEYILSRLSLGLCGESGEVAEAVKKFLRGDYDIEKLKSLLFKELGDVEWYISELCNILELCLDEVCKANLEKLRDRKKRGTIKGSGDNR